MLRFLLAAVGISVLIAGPLFFVQWQTTSPFLRGLVSSTLGMVPAWSLMLAALGAPIERKLRFSLALAAFAIAFFSFAYLTGWTEVATRYTMTYAPEDAQLVESYRLAWVAAPLVALILFVGKRPSVLWTRDAAPAER